MKTAVLKRFGQEVDLADPDKVTHTLVFDIGGKAVSIPVQAETVQALVKELYAGAPERPSAPSKPTSEYTPPEVESDPRHSEQDVAQATEFGGGGTNEVPAAGVEEQPLGEVDPDHCPNCGYPDPKKGEQEGCVYTPGQTCARCGWFDAPDSDEEVSSL